MQTERVEGPVALPGVTGDVLDEGQWTAGRRDSIELDHQDGAALVLHHLRSEEDLLVHRGTQSDLTTLTTRVPERGAAELLSIDLSARPGPEQAATLEVAVVEFDGTGAPLRTTHHGPGGPHLHLFGADCTHYLVALRLRGVGSVQLRHLRVQSHAGRALREITGTGSIRTLQGPVGLHNMHGEVAEGQWTPGRRHVFSLETRDRSLSVIHHSEDQADYLIHRGSMADFAELTTSVPGLGSTRMLSIDLAVRSDPGSAAKVTVAVLEFDSSGTKTEVTFHGVGGPRLHALRPDSTHALIALRVMGRGALQLRHLRVQRHDTEVLPVDRAWMAERARTPLPDAVRRALLSAARALPTTSGSRRHAPRDCAIGLIGDDRAQELFDGSVRRIDRIRPGHVWPEESESMPDLVVWVAGREHESSQWQDDQLTEVLQTARDRGCPTVYLDTTGTGLAKTGPWIHVDHLFSADPHRQTSGEADLPQGRVHDLPFAVNPRVAHPIGAFRSVGNGVLHDGGRPAEERRAQDLEMVLDSVVDSGVDLMVVDPHLNDTERALPGRFRSLSLGPMDRADTRALRKLFRHHVAGGTARLGGSLWDGDTAELQAQGLSVLSTFSSTVFHALPDVRSVSVPEDLGELDGPITPVELGARLDGIRRALSGHTVFDLVDHILSTVGLEPGQDNARVLVLADDVEQARPSVQRQTHQDLILRARADFQDATALDEFCRAESIAYLAPWSSATHYGEHYLQDRLNAFSFADCDYVTQLVDAADWQLGEHPVHEYTETCGVPEHTVFSLARQPASQWWAVQDGEELLDGYAADPYHVDWPVGRRFAVAPNQDAGGAPRLTVVVPVFDNGRYLLSVSLPSLRRHRMWPQMEVALVDDGSSDPETVEICESLARECSNISLHRFDDGGSGSASRPRNQGARAATTDLVAFLDPDNEISPGGYDRLVETYEELNASGSSVQFVGGYQVKVDERSQVMGRHAKGVRVPEDIRAEFFHRGRFPLISTQAAVMDRTLFTERGLDFVEGAIGEDTLFGWEVVLTADRVAFTDRAHLLYYSGRDGSVTNVLDESFFRKHLILERARVQRLREYGLYRRYVDQHLEHYLENWYRPRLDRVRDQDQAACRAILAEIENLYRTAEESPPSTV